MAVIFENIDANNPENLDSQRYFYPFDTDAPAGTGIVFKDATNPLAIEAANEQTPYAFLRQDIKKPAVGDDIPSLADKVFGIWRNQTKANSPCSLVVNKLGLRMKTDVVGASITNLVVPIMPNGEKIVKIAGVWELESAYPGKPSNYRMIENKIGDPDLALVKDFPNGYIRIVCKA